MECRSDLRPFDARTSVAPLRYIRRSIPKIPISQMRLVEPLPLATGEETGRAIGIQTPVLNGHCPLQDLPLHMGILRPFNLPPFASSLVSSFDAWQESKSGGLHSRRTAKDRVRSLRRKVERCRGCRCRMTAASSHTGVCGEACSARLVCRPLWPASEPIADDVRTEHQRFLREHSDARQRFALYRQRSPLHGAEQQFLVWRFWWLVFFRDVRSVRTSLAK